LNQQDYDLYMYIANYIEKRGYSPLLAEIAEVFEMSEQAIPFQIQRLWNQGYISYPPHLSGMIYLTSKTPDFKPELPRTKPKPIVAVKKGNPKTAIYHYIADYIDLCQRSPSLDEIGKGLDMGKTTVKYYVDQLKKAGYLKSQPRKHRSLVLTGQKIAG